MQKDRDKLRSLRVENTKYILRHRLIVTNLTQLLFPTNEPPANTPTQ